MVILELIKIKKMSNGFDESIFGQLIQPQPIQQIQDSIKTSQSITQSQYAFQQHSTNTSLKTQKYKKYPNVKFNPASQSSTCVDYSFNGYAGKSAYGDDHIQTKMEKMKVGLINLLKQLNLKKVGQDDIFYCGCGEQQNKKNQCIACQGKCGIDGTNNMIKFIQYVMQFKLGLQQSYISKKQMQSQQNLPLNKKQNTSILNSTNSQIKNNISISKSASLAKQTNPINSFCLDFLKQQKNQPQPKPQQKKYKSEIISQYHPYQTNQYEQCNKKFKTRNTINTNQSTEINGNNNSSYFGVNAIRLGLNSMTQSVVNQEYEAYGGYGGAQDEVYGGNCVGGDARDSIRSSTNTYNNVQDEYNATYGQPSPYNSYITHSYNRPSQCNYNAQARKSQMKQFNNKLNCSSIRSSVNSVSNYNNQFLQQQNNSYMPINSKSMIVGLNKYKSDRKSVPCKPFLNFHEYKQKLSQQSSIHKDFSCDICRVMPIQGTRYHCQSLTCNNDYDLCQKCYKQKGHKHKMVPIKFNSNVQQFCEGLQQFSQKCIKASIQISVGGMVNSMGGNAVSKQCKSINNSNSNSKYGNMGGSSGYRNIENSCRIDDDGEEYGKNIFKSSIR